MLVRREGIEPPSVPCKGTALPLDERRMGCPKGIDPLPWAPHAQVLPLHQGHHGPTGLNRTAVCPLGEGHSVH